MANVVHVVGASGAGETLTCLLADFARELGLHEVTFQRRSAFEADRPRLKAMLDKGALMAASGDTRGALERMGLEVALEPQAALERASVIVDTTPWAGQQREAYGRLAQLKGCVALQGDGSFGPAVAYGVNLNALRRGQDRMLRVASAGAHGMGLLLSALGGQQGSRVKAPLEGRFVSMPRGSDIASAVDVLAAPAFQPHVHVEAGTEDGATAQAMLKGAGVEVPVFSSTVELNHQLLHALHFSIRLPEALGTADALERLRSHGRVAMTDKMSANPVFAFGRDHGYAGRLFNALVVPRAAVAVRPGQEVVGFCWLPPDGCELYTAVALILWLLDGETGLKRLGALKPYVFEDV